MASTHLSPFWAEFREEQAKAYAGFGPLADKFLDLDIEARIAAARIVGNTAAAEAPAIFDIRDNRLSVALDINQGLIPADRRAAANAAASLTRSAAGRA